VRRVVPVFLFKSLFFVELNERFLGRLGRANSQVVTVAAGKPLPRRLATVCGSYVLISSASPSADVFGVLRDSDLSWSPDRIVLMFDVDHSSRVNLVLLLLAVLVQLSSLRSNEEHID